MGLNEELAAIMAEASKSRYIVTRKIKRFFTTQPKFTGSSNEDAVVTLFLTREVRKKQAYMKLKLKATFNTKETVNTNLRQNKQPETAQAPEQEAKTTEELTRNNHLWMELALVLARCWQSFLCKQYMTGTGGLFGLPPEDGRYPTDSSFGGSGLSKPRCSVDIGLFFGCFAAAKKVSIKSRTLDDDELTRRAKETWSQQDGCQGNMAALNRVNRGQLFSEVIAMVQTQNPNDVTQAFGPDVSHSNGNGVFLGTTDDVRKRPCRIIQPRGVPRALAKRHICAVWKAVKLVIEWSAWTLYWTHPGTKFTYLLIGLLPGIPDFLSARSVLGTP
ncbi:hypothetical protein C8J56DRAFT_897327 [Mycena floridula]|nr:hypothetical protein C8J56DRAFT_897327 [Mycena floridula]